MSADAAAPRYWAFISYSHRDEAVAKRLQRQLETYRLPRKLVGREGPEGPVPARVRPLFRDRDELHAGDDLKAHVQQALAASRWLIVVCSPDAARSPWVEREIVEFKRPARRAPRAGADRRRRARVVLPERAAPRAR